jgi:hypothetical protein
MSQKRTDHNEELFVCGWLIDAAVRQLNADPNDTDSWRLIRWALERLQDRGAKMPPGTIEDLKPLLKRRCRYETRSVVT